MSCLLFWHHKWGNWSDVGTAVTAGIGSGRPAIVQEKRCSECNQVKLRIEVAA